MHNPATPFERLRLNVDDLATVLRGEYVSIVYSPHMTPGEKVQALAVLASTVESFCTQFAHRVAGWSPTTHALFRRLCGFTSEGIPPMEDMQTILDNAIQVVADVKNGEVFVIPADTSDVTEEPNR
jgi:hypothetical protein